MILISTPFTMVHICTEKPFLYCGHGPKESHEAYVSSLTKPFRLIGSMFYNWPSSIRQITPLSKTVEYFSIPISKKHLNIISSNELLEGL